MRYLFYSILCVMLLSAKLSAQNAVIPDPAFRAFLVTNYSWLMNAEEQLNITNAASVTGTFYCGEANISSLEGIQHFVNIEELVCMKNNLTTLPDLSTLTKLTRIDCYINQLTSLPSLDGLVNLKILHVGENRLTTLPDLAALTNLTELIVYRNKLTAIPDLSTLTNLTRLDCYENQLTVLPALNTLVNLKVLHVGENHLNVLPDLAALTNLTDLIVYRNELTSLPDLTGHTSLQRLHCFENQLTSIGKMPASLLQLWFGRNYMTYVPDISLCTGLTQLTAYTNQLQVMPDLSPYTALTELNLGTNQLQAVPPSIASLSQLAVLTLDNNGFTALPDLSALALLTMCKLENNAFTFEDLLPSAANPNIGSWTLSPQDSLQVPVYTRVAEGQPVTVSLLEDGGVPGLTYSWYCNGLLATQTAEPVLTLPAATKAHTGKWYCAVTSSNPALSACTLTSRIFTIAVLPDFMPDKELTITPNGDGKNDEWLFEETGLLKVYNTAGMLLDQQASPCYWTGSTSSGRPLGTGYYLIRINEDTVYQVTIIR